MLFLVFYFLLFAVLLFQGTHVAGEVKNPLGTLPEEVAQNPVAASRWGLLLILVGLFGAALGLLSFRNPGLAKALPGFFAVGVASLIGYGLWVIFLGRKAEFIGKAAPVDNHGHH